MLRLLVTQWQGGHVLGAHLLTGLHLKTKGPFEEVPVDLDASLEEEQGIVGRSVLLKRARSSKSKAQA